MLVYQLQHYIQPQHIDEYLAATLENARLSRQEPGVIRFDVFRDPEDPTHFSLIEGYIDESAREKHLLTDHFLRWKSVYLDQEIYQRRGDLHNWEYLEPLEPPQLGLEAEVSLREISGDTVRDICRLEVGKAQSKFVAPNSISIAQAHFEPKAWFRGIYAEETAVGFVMLFDDADQPEYYLWRYMIDLRYQGLGFGSAGIRHLVEYVRSRPKAAELVTSYVPGAGSPHDFYLKMGFVDTGVEKDGEWELRLVL